MTKKKLSTRRSIALKGLAERLSPKEPDRIPLIRFVREAWRIVDPAPYIHNWHVEAICDHLEAVTFGEISELIINVPPGFGKSLIVSVFLASLGMDFSSGNSLVIYISQSGPCYTRQYSVSEATSIPLVSKAVGIGLSVGEGSKSEKSLREQSRRLEDCLVFGEFRYWRAHRSGYSG